MISQNKFKERKALGYPDLPNPEYVFTALLGHGMFTEMLPPCFTSKPLLKYMENNKNVSSKWHSCVNYFSYRNTNVPRQFGIPHPESYATLCITIENHWLKINQHTLTWYSRCHVRKIEGEERIFKMNYQGSNKWHEEEEEIDFSMGCNYVVKTDISGCYPSIYSHSISWAVLDKDVAKKDLVKNPKDKEFSDHWSNELDKATRQTKGGETNGILIGPDTSNIISEIILTRIDREVGPKFNNFFRYIDDYTFYAKNEKEAKDFLRKLQIELKKYELMLNNKKTTITPYASYLPEDWTSKLSEFTFPTEAEIGFTSINRYINYAITLADENQNYSVLKYAIKVVAEKPLSERAKRLYVKKMLSLTVPYPYLLPVMEKYVFSFFSENKSYLQELLEKYLPALFIKAHEENLTDSLAFCFYYGVKFNVQFHQNSNQQSLGKEWCQKVIDINDCISMLLAWKYCTIHAKENIKFFRRKAREIAKSTPRTQDNFWIFIYEVFGKQALKTYEGDLEAKLNSESEKKTKEKNNLSFLLKLKEKNVSFLNF